MIFTIAYRELRSLFLSPLAWVLLAVVQFLAAWLFLSQVEAYMIWQDKILLQQAAGLTGRVVMPMIGTSATLVMLVIPMLTMNSFSQEQRQSTLQLLMFCPISLSDLVFGKLFGFALFSFIPVLLTSGMVFSLLLGGELDTGRILAGLLGMFLVLILAAAIGLYCSSLTRQASLAAILAYGGLFFLSMVGVSAGGESNGLRYFAMDTHFGRLLSGMLDSGSLAYFLIMIVGFSCLTMIQLDRRKRI